ncbi:transcriptional regulator [Halobacteria archaeon HArc-gm2]|nr:transcriptional regulator [Halobacteria archaeon HArc-gm2]
MTDVVTEDLRRELRCVELLGCFHGLNERDVTVFAMLADAGEPVTVDRIADGLDCERSTAYRSVSRLLDADVVVQTQVNNDRGGYYHEYEPRDAAALADQLRRRLNDRYARLGRMIAAFRERHVADRDCQSAVRRDRGAGRDRSNG